MSAARALARLILGTRARARMLDGFVDSLVQSFENCRPGLSDDALASGGATALNFFTVQYEKERPRLKELVRLQHGHLSEAGQAELFDKIDSYVQSVLVPAYARVARQFTKRERNDFYLSPSSWHGAERAGFAVAGMALGGLVVAAPFIPLYAKEWVLVFGVGGLTFPEIRRLLGLKRYESEVNNLVRSADDEIFRMDLALLTLEPLPEAHTVREGESKAPHPEKNPDDSPQAGKRTREGGR